MDPENDGVIGSDSQAEEVETPAPEDRSGVEPSGSGEKENRIPYSRVREMIAKERDRALAEFREKEHAPLRKQLEDLTQRQTQAELARLKAMGWLKDEQPKPVTQEDMEKYWSEREKKLEEKNLQLYHAQRIDDGWSAVRAKYPGLAKLKSFQDSVLARYVNNPKTTFAEHGDAVAKDFEAYYSDKQKDAAKEREEEIRPDRRVVPGGRGAAGGGGKASGKKPKSVGDKLVSALTGKGE